MQIYIGHIISHSSRYIQITELQSELDNERMDKLI